jgi:hypothetical protein
MRPDQCGLPGSCQLQVAWAERIVNRVQTVDQLPIR